MKEGAPSNAPVQRRAALEESAHEASDHSYHRTETRTIDAVGHGTKATEQGVAALEVTVQAVGRASTEPDAHAEHTTFEFRRHVPPCRHLQRTGCRPARPGFRSTAAPRNRLSASVGCRWMVATAIGVERPAS